VELLLERSETRTDSVGEYIVSNVGIRRSASEPVAGSIEPSTGIAKASSDDIDATPPRPRRSADAFDEDDGGDRTAESTDTEQSEPQMRVFALAPSFVRRTAALASAG